jgi:hypothetical protein
MRNAVKIMRFSITYIELPFIVPNILTIHSGTLLLEIGRFQGMVNFKSLTLSLPMRWAISQPSSMTSSLASSSHDQPHPRASSVHI